jgi:hypothetical protein
VHGPTLFLFSFFLLPFAFCLQTMTRRTIRRDIDYLRDQLNVPIEFDSVRNGYHDTEPTYRLPFPQLTQGEMLSLYLSERMMRQFRGTPFERDLRQTISKLSELLPDGVSVRLDAIADFLSVLPAVQADYDPELGCAVLRAAVGRRRLKMVYWTETGERFDRPADFRAADYMKGSFRAMRGDDDHVVVVRFGSDATFAVFVTADRFPGFNGFEQACVCAPVNSI